MIETNIIPDNTDYKELSPFELMYRAPGAEKHQPLTEVLDELILQVQEVTSQNVRMVNHMILMQKKIDEMSEEISSMQRDINSCKLSTAKF